VDTNTTPPVDDDEPRAEPGRSPGRKGEWLTIPNLLSLGRLVLTPVLGWLILSEKTVIATVLFGVMGVTDYLDGYIARRTNTVTDLGTTLDPVSDRVLVMTALITMMLTDPAGRDPRMLPFWLGLPVLLRDAALSVAFLMLARRGFGKPKVRRVGKTATFALLTALPALVLGGAIRPVGIALFAFGGILYFVAGYRYYQDMRNFLEHQRRPFA
jgi:cardiolipin synthase (CMP-forming)